ncbi:bifunctional riboflavin kinase/FAD synthetase [Rickettsiales bacterium]|nr:bifunctional riboflavin kinase/FAD synthetase [Rickettsiales bacterium]
MEIIFDYQNIPEKAKKSVAALGNFDGFHKGHKTIIDNCHNIARAKNTPTSIITFEPHPVSLFKPDSEPFRITTFEQKAALIEKCGVDYLFCMKFDKGFSNISADDFIEKILIGDLDVSHVVIGYDFIFGHNRQGNAEFLKERLDAHNIGFSQLEAIGSSDITYSSSKVREYIKVGDLSKVRQILGHNFKISGKIIKGDQRGRQIGFPTANIELGSYVRPARGVYAIKVEIEGNLHIGVANFGIRPSFDGNKELLEVHIFDFSEDIYGIDIEVELVDYIREEKRFENIESLISKIKEDCNRAKAILV